MEVSVVNKVCTKCGTDSPKRWARRDLCRNCYEKDRLENDIEHYERVRQNSRRWQEKRRAKNVLPVISKLCASCNSIKTTKWWYQDTCGSCQTRKYSHRSHAASRQYNERQAEYRKTVKSAYSALKTTVKSEGLELDIAFEDYVKIREQGCFYCQCPLGTGKQLDRIDNEKGHIKDNVIPCCTECNRARGDRYSVEEFKAVIEMLKGSRNRKCPWHQ